MNRIKSIIVVFVLGAAIGTIAGRWPRARPSLPCDPADVRLDARGVAHCAPGTELPVGQAITVGQRVNLNAVSEDELTLLPGVTEAVAHALVETRERLGGFHSWDQVDAVDGVGPARLSVLQAHCEIGAVDAGLW